MHAQYVRVFFVAGIAALVLSLFLSFLTSVGPSVAVLGVSYLALALALGLLPAFARRDWPSPVYAYAAALLGALGLAASPAARVSHALLGASLVVGALQPLALLLSPRWTGASEPDAHGPTDRAALAGIGLALAATLAGGLLFVALPRGLPNAAFATLLLAAAPAAALAALLFTLPRLAGEPLKGATLAHAANAAWLLGTVALAWAFARPLGAGFRTPVALIALGFAFAVATLLRAKRPAHARPLLGAAFALAVLAPLALLLATLYDAPNALLPAAFFALLALDLVALSAALVVGAPLLLPGRAREGRWSAWAGALVVASLFLYTPALQLGRSSAPALLVAALGLALLVRGLAPMATPEPMRSARRR